MYGYLNDIAIKYLEDGLLYNKDNRVCHIAFLLKGKKMVRIGYNQMHRNYYNRKVITSLHAEVDCIRKLTGCKNYNRYSILVINIYKGRNNSVHFKDSRPCKDCTNFLKEKGYKNIFCSTEKGIIEKINFNSYDPYITLARQKTNQ
jgi:deoxycytidylate deaminase